MTRDEALARIAKVRADSQAMLGTGILDDEVNVLIALLDATTALVRDEWPLGTTARAKVVIGRYASRAFEEREYHDLSRDVAQLDWDLTH